MKNPWVGRVCLLMALLFTLTYCQEDDGSINPIDDEPLVNNMNGDGQGGNNGGQGGNNGGQGGNNGGPGNPPAPPGGGNGGNNNGGLAALPLNISTPANNPQSQAKIELGRALFWDPILSGAMDVACATCHHPARGYTDGIDLSIGVGGIGFAQNRVVGPLGFAGRNAPSVINTAYNGIDNNGNVNPTNAPMFWDSRANGLEEQSLGPIHSFVEMRGNTYPEDQTLTVVIDRLLDIDEYRNMFQAAFGTQNITSEDIARAISSFERSIVANNSPFDQFMRGNQNAMSQQQAARNEPISTNWLW